jgi:hypothetical protein
MSTSLINSFNINPNNPDKERSMKGERFDYNTPLCSLFSNTGFQSLGSSRLYNTFTPTVFLGFLCPLLF